MNNLEMFPGNNNETIQMNNHDRQLEDLSIILNRSYDQSRGEDQFYIVDNLDKYPDLSHSEIVDKLIESRHGEQVAKNLDKFQGLDQQAVANKLIESGQGIQVVNNIDKFKDLDQSVRQEIIKKLAA